MKMIYMKQLTLVCALIIAQTAHAADIPKVMKISGSIGEAIIGAGISLFVKDKAKQKAYKAKVAKVTDFLGRASFVAQNALDFKDHLPVIKEKAKLLNARIKCLDHVGQAQCSVANMGCTSEEMCIAKMLQALAELLDPLIADMLGKREIGSDGKPTDKIKPGALLSLVGMLPKGPKKDKYEKPLLEYIDTTDVTLKFIHSLIYGIEPVEVAKKEIDADNTLSPAVKALEKKAIEEEPIELKEDTDLSEFA